MPNEKFSDFALQVAPPAVGDELVGFLSGGGPGSNARWPAGLVTGGLTVGGSAIGGGTDGAVLFQGTGAVLGEDAPNLFWDITNKALGVGTNITIDSTARQAALSVKGAPSTDIGLFSDGTSEFMIWINHTDHVPVELGTITNDGLAFFVNNGLPIMTICNTGGISLFDFARDPNFTNAPADVLLIGTGAQSPIFIAKDATFPAYNLISLNGANTFNNAIGFEAGATGDGTLYFLGQSGMQMIVAGFSTSVPAIQIDNAAIVTLANLITLTAQGVGSLPGAPVLGMVAAVNTALAPVVGTPVAAGGAANALVWWNGANWNVVAV